MKAKIAMLERYGRPVLHCGGGGGKGRGGAHKKKLMRPLKPNFEPCRELLLGLFCICWQVEEGGQRDKRVLGEEGGHREAGWE